MTFLDETLCIQIPHAELLSEEELVPKLIAKLDRPIRVCGMVRNEGEPGGGPYLVREADGTTSLQILESVQVDKNNPEALEMMREGTHFNPVDLCCYIRDYEDVYKRQLYGGFAGSETSRDDRTATEMIGNCYSTNETILSADDDVPDVWTRVEGAGSMVREEWEITGNEGNYNHILYSTTPFALSLIHI